MVPGCGAFLGGFAGCG